MEQIKGLREYVALKTYRDALGLPAQIQEEYELLAQGEYNRNYLFTHPVTGKKLVLRVNCGSQMHSQDQIKYEYDALKLLGPSGRTPIPSYVDGSLRKIAHGIMVMEFLPGHPLDYKSELVYGAECLADIHSTRIGENHSLIEPKDPLKAILDECEVMVTTYMDSELGADRLKERIRSMLDKAWELWKRYPVWNEYKCCVNTELNSTNFLINGDGRGNYLIDWEKPIYGDPAQDLGHFLAPTTTFWKTDVILKPEEMRNFLDSYVSHVDHRYDTGGLMERTLTYIPITCLRGITWCAMAWVEYQQPDKLLFNQFTLHKLEAYLSEGFLEEIEQLLCSGMHF